MSNPKIQIFIADDHAVLRAGLRLLLNAEPDMTVCGEAGDGLEAIERLSLIQPDVILLDISMPRVNGLECLAQIHELRPSSAILILTMHNDEAYLRKALSIGASGYVLKQAANTELLSAIRVVQQGGTYLHAEHRGLLFEKAAGGEALTAAVSENAPTEPLSQRESEILVLIAMGYSSRQAAEKLFLSEKTVETYKSRLMNKLNIRSRVELVRYAMQHGYIKA